MFGLRSSRAARASELFALRTVFDLLMCANLLEEPNGHPLKTAAAANESGHLSSFSRFSDFFRF